jgi:uncharacterized protein YerC
MTSDSKLKRITECYSFISDIGSAFFNESGILVLTLSRFKSCFKYLVESVGVIIPSGFYSSSLGTNSQNLNSF